MEYTISRVIAERIEAFLARTGIDPGVEVDSLTGLVLSNAVYWEKELGGGKFRRLVLIKFNSPVVMREEVFLGSVLLNCFLSRQVLLTCKEYNLGEIDLIGNDVENFYYLWATNTTLAEFADCYLKAVESSLPDLYFGEQDEEKGVYGDLKKMFAFHKNNIEAFPIFAMPEALVSRLGEIARLYLLEEIRTNPFTRNPTTITANMSFFLSKEGDENQSPYLLLARTFSRYALIDEKQIKKAFNLTGQYDCTKKEGEKKLQKDIEESLKKQRYSPVEVKNILTDIINAYAEQAEKAPAEWSVGYCRGKALKLTPAQVTAELTTGTRLGFHGFTSNIEGEKLPGGTYCRSCGSGQAMLLENHIIMGEDVGKFHNQIIHKKGSAPEKICVKCCIRAYLINKLLGSTPGNLSFVPQQSSIIFHYGRHNDEEVQAIAVLLKDAFNLIKQRRNLRSELYRFQSDKKEIEARLASVKGGKTRENYLDQLKKKEEEIQARTLSLQELSQNLLEVINKTGTSTFSSKPVITLEDPALEIIADTGITLESTENDSAEHYIFGIGLGDYRLLAFVLPEIKHRLEKKGHDYVQQRFSNSRVTVLTVLAFLRKICNCDGPWYYFTLPALTAGWFSTDAFYVRGRKYSAREVSDYYEIFSGFANKVTRWGQDILIRKIMMTEKMLEDPLTVLSEVLRNSSIFTRQDNPGYNLIYDQATGRPDPDAYLYYFKQFQEYKKVTSEGDD